MFGVPVNVPLNPEGVFGLLATLALLLRGTENDQGAQVRRSKASGWTVAILGLAALWPALRVGLLSDDFILVTQARDFSLRSFAPLFTNAGGDGFFRPLGYVTLGWTYALAQLNTTWWHAIALGLHVMNAILLGKFATRLGASRWSAFATALLFTLHGTHLEAAVWIAGHFDLLATLFVLLTLLGYTRSTVVAVLAALAALWSKEAAYVLPILVTLLAWYERKDLRTTIPYWLLTLGAFAYRWTLLGGIGGYRTEGGQLAFLALSPASTAKALFVRTWTSLYFPLNWSREPGWFTAALCGLYVLAIAWVVTRAAGSRAMRWTGASLAVSLLPALHLLGGAADLSGGRLLYVVVLPPPRTRGTSTSRRGHLDIGVSPCLPTTRLTLLVRGIHARSTTVSATADYRRPQVNQRRARVGEWIRRVSGVAQAPLSTSHSPCFTSARVKTASPEMKNTSSERIAIR
jgi:hypothetical protein